MDESVIEAGSILCGAAPNMVALIFGRAVAGLGAAGIFSGNLVILAEITSMKDRGKYMGKCFVSCQSGC